jgi:hypothetical protein
LEDGRPILSRAAAFVPADAELVVVFRAWREAVESLGLRAALSTPAGQALARAWNIADVPLTDLPGLDRIGMDVDQSMVVALLPGDLVIAVVASREPRALAELLERSTGVPGKTVSLQGREARSLVTEAARFTVVLHPAHLQVVISRPDTPAEVIDNQLQAGFDGAPVWVQRARALPTPRSASVVMWKPGASAGADARSIAPDRPLSTLLGAVGPAWHAGESVASVSAVGDTARLDVVSRVVDEPDLRARSTDTVSLEELFAVVPAGTSFTASAPISRRGLEMVAHMARRLSESRAASWPENVTRALETHLIPVMFETEGSLRSVLVAGYPAPAGGVGGASAVLTLVDLGTRGASRIAVPELLAALNGVDSASKAVVDTGSCSGVPCWRLETPERLACAVVQQLLLCGTGDAPLSAALELARRRGTVPRSDELTTIIGHVEGPVAEVPGTSAAEVPGTSADDLWPAFVRALVSGLATDVRTVTVVERVGPGQAHLVLHIGGAGRPILPSLVPHLAESLQPVLPLLE